MVRPDQKSFACQDVLLSIDYTQILDAFGQAC